MTQNPPITLARDTIDRDSIARLIRWLESSPRLTKGPATIAFEEAWASALGVRHAVFVNSGSSANLLMLSALKLTGELRSTKVVVPAVAWATDLAPVIQLGLEPVLVDINLDNLGPDLAMLEEIFASEEPAALMLVSVLGLPPNMAEIVDLCDRHGVALLEDACESLGSRYEGKMLGSFGAMASFSLYFGHHLSTIEGGMVCTDEDGLHDLLLMLRSHGWDRDLAPKDQARLRQKWDVSDFDAMYTFYVPGFNVRATDLQAFIGLEQIQRLESVAERRRANYELYCELLNPSIWKPTPPERSFVSNFAYPIVHEKRDEIVQTLIAERVEVRPLVCGSMGVQPFYADAYGRTELPNASVIDECGCYVPNHQQLTDDDIRCVCEIVNRVVGR